MFIKNKVGRGDANICRLKKEGRLTAVELSCRRKTAILFLKLKKKKERQTERETERDREKKREEAGRAAQWQTCREAHVLLKYNICSLTQIIAAAKL